MIKLARGAMLVMALLIYAPTAHAALITIEAVDVGEDFTVLASGVANPGSVPVSARLDVLITGYVIDAMTDTTTLTLDVTLANTSLGDSSLRGYGFSANPDVQTGTATGSEYGFDFVSTLLNTNSSVGNVENCVAGDEENQCTGLATDAAGLEFGQVDTHQLTLLFDGQYNALQLGDADTGVYFRFQSVGTQGGSAKIFGNPPPTPRGGDDPPPPPPPPPPPVPVPEPGSMLLLGTGLALAARSLRKRFRHA